MNAIIHNLRCDSHVSRMVLGILITLFFSHDMSATTVTWTGGGVDQLWSTADNWDTNTVPVAIDDVVIFNGDEVIINGSATCRTVSMSSSSTTLRVNGQLTMSGNPVQAILIGSSSILNNYGNINISNPLQYGIRISAGTLTNMSTGVINISNVTGSPSYGIINSGTFVNHGTINIMDCERFGFQNAQVFQNNGILNVNKTNDNAIDNTGQFDNELNGIIMVGDSVGNSIRNAAQMTNRGKMDLTGLSQGGLFNQGKFENRDSLVVNGAATYGIRNRDTLINQGTGVIIIDATPTGIFNDNFLGPNVSMVNHGAISISNGNQGLSSNAEVENHGHLDIRNMSTRGLVTDDALHNYAGATILINTVIHPFFEGVLNGSNGSIRNESQISISNISGVGMSNEGSFVQSPIGSCTTSNVTLDLFVNEAGAISDIMGVLTINK